MSGLSEPTKSIQRVSIPASLNGMEGREHFARQNHSEIERRRRTKMTHYINELADMVD